MPDAPKSAPPVPASVSEQAQRYLAGGNPYGTAEPPPDALDDVEGWLRHIEQADAALEDAFATLMPSDLPLDRRETDVEGVRTFVLQPHGVADSPVFLDIHGGALIMGGGEVCALMATGSALLRGMTTWAVDYRMPPLHPYPAGLDDCITVYRRLLELHDPTDIFVGGASAGGNLAPALLLRAKEEGLPMPAALVLLTPEVDLTESGDSFHTNADNDLVLGSLMTVNRLYANGHDLAHPYISPLFGDLTGFPPTFLQAGTRDLFLSNTVRMHRALRNAGVEAELHVWEAMPHGGFGGGTPEDAEIGAEVRRFLEAHRR